MTYTATYSPEDNKLRLYSESRLDKDLYARVKELGFKWAPKQGFFVAPMWTPQRNDILLELCGEIGDEDKSLVERSEERAERFEGYQENRAKDAERAHTGVSAITDNIPFGQPILIGHHSEKHARKDAQRIESGMRKAVKMWETSEYWARRAQGALNHAKYKELPEVRARRIKGLEADKRKQERTKKEAEGFLQAYLSQDIEATKLKSILSNYGGGLNYDNQRALDKGELSLNDALTMAIKTKQSTISWCNRWIEHYVNRLAYEIAMLDEQGESQLIAKKERPKQLPLCNYMQSSGFDIKNRWNKWKIDHYPQVVMTKEEYAKIYNDYKGTEIISNSHRVRMAMIRNSEARKNDPNGLGAHGLIRCCVFLSNSKVTEPPMSKDTPLIPEVSGIDAIKSAEALKDLSTTWEELPRGIFTDTNVSTVLLTIDN